MASPVLIERLVVEEGFLDGLDLAFAPGLNVIIGPRGVGKTSVIQLLRFCLGVPAFSGTFEAAAQAHARNILGDDGRVSVRLIVEGEPIVISRRRRDEHPEGSVASMPEPIILAQTEIEEIGVDPEGRLRLIDDFRVDSRGYVARERAATSTIKSLMIELRDLERDIEIQQERLKGLDHERDELNKAEAEVSVAEQTVSAASDDLQRLDVLGREVAAAQVRLGALSRTAKALEGWLNEVSLARRNSPAVERWPESGVDVLEAARASVKSAESALDEVESEIGQAQDELRGRAEAEATQITAWEDEARLLRHRVEQLQEGAGVAVRRLAALRERVAQSQSLEALMQEQEARRDQVRASRDEALLELDALREGRFDERLNIAGSLNGALGPRIAVEVQRSGHWTAYSDAIANTIRGKGLHYTELAPQIAACLSPHELTRLVELDDAPTLASRVKIPEDRARRVIDRIKEAGLVDLITADIEDSVRLSLLDGSEYKLSENLSTGQRCTTILPIILRHQERPVIIDQPEDHLDGAFIVDTLVQAIIQRADGSQLILSTHNPNIPVLGDAERVTLLGSDGHRGFEVHSGDLRDGEVVDAITSVMEGGAEAFARRAEFYGAR